MITASVVLYEHVDYQGASLTVSDDLVSDDLATMPPGWDNRVSSVRTSTPVALFQNNDYGGEVLILNEDTPSLTNIRGRSFNDMASSVRVKPRVIRLNVIVGVREAQPARSFEDINQDIAVANALYGPYGILFDVAKLTTGSSQLYEPHTMLNVVAERDPLLAKDHLNVTYFSGPLYNDISWRWLARSVRIVGTQDHNGSLKCRLYTNPNYSGSRYDVSRELVSIPSSHRGNIRSLGIDEDTAVTLYSKENFEGRARTFYHDVPELDNHKDFADWWHDKQNHFVGDNSNWNNCNITVQPGSSNRELAGALGLALNVPWPSGSIVSFIQAEAAMRHLHDHTALKPFIMTLS